MKRTLRALLSVAVLTIIVHAQQRSKAVLEVAGANLRLGMTKAQVAEKLAGHEIAKLHEDEWMVGSLEKKELGPTLQFTNGVLSFADRYWTTYDNDVAEALFGAVSSLNSEGLLNCVVTADTAASPSLTAQRVWIKCGEKSILLVRRSFGGKSYNSVYERLGNMKDTTE
jgi:hypothetical protein